jgi:hypothetical protein
MLDCIRYYKNIDIVRFEMYIDVHKVLKHTEFEMRKSPDSKTVGIGIVSETGRCEDASMNYDDFHSFVKKRFLGCRE